MEANELKDEINNMMKNVASSAEDAATSAAKAEAALSSIRDFTDILLEVKAISEEKVENAKKGKAIKEYLEDYEYFSGKASDINRSLALAGLAAIWLLLKDTDILNKTDALVSTRLPKQLFLPFMCLLITLTLDLLHYIAGSAIWGMFHRSIIRKWKLKKSLMKKLQILNLQAHSEVL
jgi:hypothetical protein